MPHEAAYIVATTYLTCFTGSSVCVAQTATQSLCPLSKSTPFDASHHKHDQSKRFEEEQTVLELQRLQERCQGVDESMGVNEGSSYRTTLEQAIQVVNHEVPEVP